MDVAQLVLSEICRDPDIVKLNDREQSLTRLYVLSNFSGLLSDHTRDRRYDVRIAQVEFGLVQYGLRRGSRRLALVEQRRGRAFAAAPSLARAESTCASSTCAILNLVLVLLARNHIAREKLVITIEVSLGLGVGRHSLCQVGRGYAIIVTRRNQSGLGLAQIGAGQIERHLVIAGIYIGQGISLLHVVRVFDMDLNDSAVDSRANRIQMAVDLRVVGPFVGMQEVPQKAPGYNKNRRSGNRAHDLPSAGAN